MIILTTTSDKIRVKLAAASGTDVKLVACWRDITSTTYLPARNGTSSNGSTEVNLVTSPSASHQLKVDFLSAYNADSVGHTVTFEFYDGSNAYPLWIGALGVSESVQYIEGIGFHRIDATGNRIDASTTGAAPAGTGFVRVTSGAYDTPSASIAQAVVTNLTSDLALKAPLLSPSFTTPSLGVAVMNGDIVPNATNTFSIGSNDFFLSTVKATQVDCSAIQVGIEPDANLAGSIYLYSNNTGNYTLITSSSTASRSVAFPDASGTLALTSDIKSPGGSSGDVQYNNAGAFGGVSGLTLSSGVLQTQTITFSSAGATPNTGQTIINATAATAGVQSASPAAVWAGNGWKTTATAASQDVRFRAYVLPIQGTANPTGSWVLQSSINGAAYSNVFSFTSGGVLVSGDGVTSLSNRVLKMSNVCYLDGQGFGSTSGLQLGKRNTVAWGSDDNVTVGSKDTFLTRGVSAANICQGATVATATPVPQTSSVQSVATGTSNTAGANRTYSASQGTGTGAGGKHIFQVATKGASEFVQNTLVTALEIREDRSLFLADVSAAPAAQAGGGLLYVEAGALKYIGSSGTITTLGAA